VCLLGGTILANYGLWLTRERLHKIRWLTFLVSTSERKQRLGGLSSPDWKAAIQCDCPSKGSLPTHCWPNRPAGRM